jgi:hypothetical protein
LNHCIQNIASPESYNSKQQPLKYKQLMLQQVLIAKEMTSTCQIKDGGMNGM